MLGLPPEPVAQSLAQLSQSSPASQAAMSLQGAADVMNGFGSDDVANGSFEETAPFGGWGWRYFDDDGVSRLSDGSAHSGARYLRLENHAATHQQLPASDGDTFIFSAWMRAANDGEQVDMTIDFRDQGAGSWASSPMTASTETKVLTTSWQQYSMSATAPVGAANPVFHTRVTLRAASGAVVDVDDVSAGLGGCGDAFCGPGEDSCNCAADCGTPPGTETVCDDGADDDCDGNVDCDDVDCVGEPICADPCNDNNVCEAGEDCDNCSNDCASRSSGKPSNRYCCGNGVQEGPEGDGRCDGNV